MILYPIAAPHQLQYLQSLFDFNTGKSEDVMGIEQMSSPNTYYTRSKSKCKEFDERCDYKMDLWTM
jgi:hypothetical protein